MRRPRRHAFTLIELLVVIAIIALLSALVLRVAGYVQKEGARKRAAGEIAALSTALEQYKIDNGDYPANSQPGVAGARVLFQALVAVNTTNNPLNKTYFTASKNILNSGNYSAATNYFQDPFGSPYEYRYPGTNTKSGSSFFDLWSYGGTTGSKTNESNTNNFPFWIINW